MLTLTLLLASSLAAASDLVSPPGTIPCEIAAPWTLVLGPGSTGDNAVTLKEKVSIEVPPPARITVRGERHAALAPFNEKAGGWMKGTRPQALITVECTATGALYPESLRVYSVADPSAEPYTLDKDYRIDPLWGTVGRVEGGAIAADTAVYLDYDYTPEQVDTIAVDHAGRLRLVQGKPGMGSVLPPALCEDETGLVTVFLHGGMEYLGNESVFPVQFPRAEAARPNPVAEKMLPKTLAKLRAGEKVTIVAFGDSVTCGGGVDGHPELFYQTQFVDQLRARFPKATIELHHAGWGGANSKMYMDAPAGGKYDYQRDVLGPKPDLVTIEFVNDAYLDEPGVAAHYGKILNDLRGAGAETIFITPHLVRPDWLKTTTMKLDEDPRPYVRGLRQFAERENIAVADASKQWCLLWRQGIPYSTLFSNSINHPDERGHRIFANALMAVFPEK